MQYNVFYRSHEFVLRKKAYLIEIGFLYLFICLVYAPWTMEITPFQSSRRHLPPAFNNAEYTSP